MSIRKTEEKLKINTAAIMNGEQYRRSSLVAKALGMLGLLPILLFGADAMAFDLDAGVKAATSPLIQAVSDHWGKALLITFFLSALIRESNKKIEKKEEE